MLGPGAEAALDWSPVTSSDLRGSGSDQRSDGGCYSLTAAGDEQQGELVVGMGGAEELEVNGQLQVDVKVWTAW